ncbi:hypothetical protein ACHAW5_002558 [Stephanodiscus triporus]|uniref:Peptidase A1 domain-containing protein n=1 Tax=Stephanodiscus triporus TaxID=2934178 RepID=A0ABD3MRB3_9STRA
MNHRSSFVAAAGAALMAACVVGGNDDGRTTIVALPLLTRRQVVERRRRELLPPTTRRQEGEGEGAGGGGYGDDDGDGRAHLVPLHRGDERGGAIRYYLDVYVGLPPQRQTAIVDTGSYVTAFPCSDCDGCRNDPDVSTFLEPKLSSSFHTTRCEMNDDGKCLFGSCSVGTGGGEEEEEEEDGGGLCIVEGGRRRDVDPNAVVAVADGGTMDGWVAYEATDLAYAGDDSSRKYSFPLTFGCQTSATGYQPEDGRITSGVVGLDRMAGSFWGQMRATSTIRRAIFSLCLAGTVTTVPPPSSEDDATAAGGTIVFGGVDVRLHKTPMVFAQSVGEGTSSAFVVTIRKMYLRDGGDAEASVMFDVESRYHAIDVGVGAIIDSSSSDTILVVGHVSDEFRRLWTEITGAEYSHDPIAMRESDLPRLPTVIFQLVPHPGGVGDEVRTTDPREVPGLAGKVDVGTPNDVVLAVPPRHYMRRSDVGDGTYVPRILLDGDGIVLGANAMMGHDVMFDMEEARVGISESDCVYARLANGHGGGGGGAASSSAVASSTALGGAPVNEDDHRICASNRCRVFFGLTVAALFVVFFQFARQYVGKRDVGPGIDDVGGGASEFELKSSRTILSYSDDPDHRDGHAGDRRSGRGGGGRGSADGNDYSSRSISTRSGGDSTGNRDARRSGRDLGVSETSLSSRRSSTSHRSNQSHRSNVESVRSSKRRQSHSSSGSRRTSGSRKTSGGVERAEYDDRLRYLGDNFHLDGSRRNSDDYDDDEISRPPSIA